MFKKEKCETTNESTLIYRPTKIWVENQPKVQIIIPFPKTVKKQEILLEESNDYTTFSQYLTTNCKSDLNVYIDWSCTPNKESHCEHIEHSWKVLSERINERADGTTVSVCKFEMKTYAKKNGQDGQRLEQVNIDADVAYITNATNLLSKIVHHRNLLKNYGKIIDELQNLHIGV